MEVNGTQLPDRRPAQEKLRAALVEANEANRAKTKLALEDFARQRDSRTAAARENARPGTGDRVEVSELARQAAAAEKGGREERIVELKAARRGGTLLSEARVEQAAAALLGAGAQPIEAETAAAETEITPDLTRLEADE